MFKKQYRIASTEICKGKQNVAYGRTVYAAVSVF